MIMAGHYRVPLLLSGEKRLYPVFFHRYEENTLSL
jgi:hypothetical protein